MIDLSTYPESIRPRLAVWQREGVLARILAACERYGATIESVLGRSKRRRVALARFAVWADLRSIERHGRPVYSLPDIGAMFDRHHTTVMVGIEQHLADMDRPCSMAEACAALPPKARAMMAAHGARGGSVKGRPNKSGKAWPRPRRIRPQLMCTIAPDVRAELDRRVERGGEGGVSDITERALRVYLCLPQETPR